MLLYHIITDTTENPTPTIKISQSPIITTTESTLSSLTTTSMDTTLTTTMSSPTTTSMDTTLKTDIPTFSSTPISKITTPKVTTSSKDSKPTIDLTTINNSPSLSRSDVQSTMDIFVSTVYADDLVTDSGELTTKNLIRFQRLAIVFGMFLLFIICALIGCLCLTKCKRQNKKFRRMLTSRRQLQNENRNPIFTGSIEMVDFHTRRLQELQAEDQNFKNQKSAQQKNNLKMKNNETQVEVNQQQCQPRLNIGAPVLQSTSYVNENFRPVNIYEKEQAE